jgi:site-specific DNA recombinase
MKAAIYTRVSTEEQGGDDKVSLGHQEDRCRALCEAQGWEVVKVYTQTTSGRKWQRLEPMLADARAGRFDVVVFLKLDRFARNLRDLLNAEHELSEHGISIASVVDNFDTATYQGRAMFQVMGSFAELEVNTITDRLRTGIVERVRSGRMYRASAAPYGYAYDPETKQLIVHEETAGIVRRIYDMYLTGDGGTPRIAVTLTSEGVPPPSAAASAARRPSRSGVWHATRICAILTSPTYKGAGQYRTKDGEVLTMPCPAIIDAADWAKVQRLMSVRGVGSSRSEVDSMLRRRLRCFCGSLLSPFRRGDNRYYKCNRRARGGHIEAVRAQHAKRRWTFAAADLEEPVKDFIRRFMDDPKMLAAHVEARVEDVQREMEERSADVTLARTDLSRLESQEERLLDMAQQGLLKDDQLRARLDAIRTEQSKASKRLKKAERATLDIADIEAQLDSFAGELADLLTPEELGVHETDDGVRHWIEPTNDADWKRAVYYLFDRIVVQCASGKRSTPVLRYEGVIASSPP